MEIKIKFAAIGIRHIQILFMFLLLTIGVGMRVQFSIAIVAMTDKTASKNPDIPVYDWNNKSLILSSFFWGYALLQILAAVLARLYGAKIFLLASMGINSSLCCLMPFVSEELGPYGVMACRAVMGLTQGFFYPSVYYVLAKWVPASERAQMGSLALAGAPFGTIISMPIAGFISASWSGWPWSFYFYGMLGFAWIIGYYFLGADTPASFQSISEKERKLIEHNMEKNNDKLRVPWKAILTSPPFWGIFFAYIGQTWGYQALLTELPIYMNKVMKFNMESNGLLSAAPYLTMFIVLLTSGYVADSLIHFKYLTVKQTRRLFSIMASFIPATALIVLSFLPEEAVTLSVIMLILAVGMQGASAAGFEVNHIDLTPNFAGILLGICNSSGEVLSIFGPMAIQLIVTNETNKAQWRIIFLAAAMSYAVTSAIFVTLVKTDVQPWNNTNLPVKENNTEKNGK